MTRTWAIWLLRMAKLVLSKLANASVATLVLSASPVKQELSSMITAMHHASLVRTSQSILSTQMLELPLLTVHMNAVMVLTQYLSTLSAKMQLSSKSTVLEEYLARWVSLLRS